MSSLNASICFSSLSAKIKSVETEWATSLNHLSLTTTSLSQDSVPVTTTAKEKTTPNFSPSPHLIGQQPFLTASPPHITHFYRQIIPFYLFSIYLYQLSPSHYTSDVF